MSTWTPDQLTTIGAAEEVRIAVARRDGSLRRPVIVWVVQQAEDLYVRSVNGRDAAWFRGAASQPDGRLWANGIEQDISFDDVSHQIALDDALDTAYRTKYRHYAATIIDAITGPQARAATLKLLPRATTTNP